MLQNPYRRLIIRYIIVVRTRHGSLKPSVAREVLGLSAKSGSEKAEHDVSVVAVPSHCNKLRAKKVHELNLGHGLRLTYIDPVPSHSYSSASLLWIHFPRGSFPFS